MFNISLLPNIANLLHLLAAKTAAIHWILKDEQFLFRVFSFFFAVFKIKVNLRLSLFNVFNLVRKGKIKITSF